MPNMPISNSIEDKDEMQNQLAFVPMVDSIANDAKYVFWHLSDVTTRTF